MLKSVFTSSRTYTRFGSVPGKQFVVIVSCIMASLFSCVSTIPQFYPDTFYPEDKVYENKTIGFLISFRGNWNIITDPDSMNRHYRSFAKTMYHAGGELLFMGSTVERLYGVKALAFNLNESPEEYATYIRSINSDEVENDSVPVEFYSAKVHAVKWIYNKSGYRFVEFFFIVDTYNIRLSFWTRPDLFDRFLPVFEEILGTVEVTSYF